MNLHYHRGDSNVKGKDLTPPILLHADNRVRIGQRRAVLLRPEHHLTQVFQVHLVTDGGTTLKLLKAFCPQRKKA